MYCGSPVTVVSVSAVSAVPVSVPVPHVGLVVLLVVGAGDGAVGVPGEDVAV